MSVEWTAAERKAVTTATSPHNGDVATSAILDALAPYVAARERTAGATALRAYAADLAANISATPWGLTEHVDDVRDYANDWPRWGGP